MKGQEAVPLDPFGARPFHEQFRGEEHHDVRVGADERGQQVAWGGRAVRAGELRGVPERHLEPRRVLQFEERAREFAQHRVQRGQYGGIGFGDHEVAVVAREQLVLAGGHVAQGEQPGQGAADDVVGVGVHVGFGVLDDNGGAVGLPPLERERVEATELLPLGSLLEQVVEGGGGPVEVAQPQVEFGAQGADLLVEGSRRARVPRAEGPGTPARGSPRQRLRASWMASRAATGSPASRRDCDLSTRSVW